MRKKKRLKKSLERYKTSTRYCSQFVDSTGLESHTEIAIKGALFIRASNGPASRVLTAHTG